MRDYFDARLADSDKRLEERLVALEKLRDMDRSYVLGRLEGITAELKALQEFKSDMSGRLKQLGAVVTFLIAIVGLINYWRGSPS